MKQALLAALAVVFFAACRKNSATPADYTGTWQLTQVSGSITINYTASDSNMLQFSGNGYQQYTRGVLVKSGTFAIVHDATVQNSTCLVFQPGQFASRIVFNGDTTSSKVFSQISGNNLTLVSGCFADDGGSFSYYTRK